MKLQMCDKNKLSTFLIAYPSFEIEISKTSELKSNIEPVFKSFLFLTIKIGSVYNKCSIV